SGLTSLAVQEANHDATVALRVRTADVNADGRTDLVWNTTGSVNRVYVSLGKADGTFDTTVLSQLNVIPVTDWEQFSMLLADVTGDGRTEIVWNHAATTNRLAVGVARTP
ncbi:MAG: FG-GAP repeat domain-containing protein, partial [Gemmatimonadaceae bacterium]